MRMPGRGRITGGSNVWRKRQAIHCHHPRRHHLHRFPSILNQRSSDRNQRVQLRPCRLRVLSRCHRVVRFIPRTVVATSMRLFLLLNAYRSKLGVGAQAGLSMRGWLGAARLDAYHKQFKDLGVSGSPVEVGGRKPLPPASTSAMHR